MAMDPRTFAARVATECEVAAHRLLELQATISDEIAGDAITPRMLAEVQALDAVHQTLADLSQVFARLSRDGPVRCGPGGIPEAALFDARQTSLRGRLRGDGDQSTGDGVDLF